VFESTAAIYNGKVVDTGAQELPLTVLVEHNLQVEILFPLKQGGNICLLGVKIAS
jgi:hypothetical protein